MITDTRGVNFDKYVGLEGVCIDENRVELTPVFGLSLLVRI